MNLHGLMGIMWFFVAVAAGAVGLVVLVVACLLRKWKFAKWTIYATISAVVVWTAVFCAAMYFLWRPYDPTSEADLNNAYRADFEVPPPPGITVLKARQVVVGDEAVQWLLLKATPEQIEKHIAQGFFPASTAPPDFSGQIGPNAPGWWKPPVGHLRLYQKNRLVPGRGETTDEAAMGVDTEAGLIWFTASHF